MIVADQPNCFPPELIAGVSSRSDGTMRGKLSVGIHTKRAIDNRWNFCQAVGCRYDDCVYLRVNYLPNNTYDVIEHVTRPNGDGVRADVLYTETLGLGLFLPVADCIATVVYDPVRKALALAHLGRHSTLANAITKTIQYFVSHGSEAKNLVVWMAPSVQQASYRMDYFDYADDPSWKEFCDVRDGGFYLNLQGYNRARAIEAGVSPRNISVSSTDCATSPDYFSHSQGDTEERNAVVAQMQK